MTGPSRPLRGRRWTSAAPDAAARDRQRRADLAEQRRRTEEARRRHLVEVGREFERVCGPVVWPGLSEDDVESIASWRAPVGHRPGCRDASCSGWPCEAGPPTQ